MDSKAQLQRITPDLLPDARRDPVDARTLAEAAAIIAEVREEGDSALRRIAERFGDLAPQAPLFLDRDDLEAARASLPQEQLFLLERAASRIRAFAQEQRACIRELDTEVPGGRAGHRITPVVRAACYAPGGRYPLPSSVLMTAIPARVAGVEEVIVASPRPARATLAAAAVAGADRVLAVGGAQAVAALAYSTASVPGCDVIVGPGNRWVTAAKLLVTGRAAIDLPGGPSELVVLADGSADPGLVAADLLAQAEHDEDALPVVISTAASLLDRVDQEIERQLRDLPTADTARAAVARGYSVLAATLEEALAACDRLAPEHLELAVADPDAVAPRLRHYGALFVGEGSAEVFGDYGAGPNHVLPTGGSARAYGGLSVLAFLRMQSWLRLEGSVDDLVRDTAAFARIEGLEAHARAAERRG